MDKQHIISEIKRTAETNGDVPLGTERFFAETGIRHSDWYGKYWARWGDALIEAGYEPNKLQGAYEDQRVIEKLISVIKELGRFPTSGDLRLKARQEKNLKSFWWKAGRYDIEVKITSPQTFKLLNSSFHFELTKNDVVLLERNVSTLETEVHNIISSNLPDFQAQPLNWNWANVDVQHSTNS